MKKYYLSITVVFCLLSCATYTSKYTDDNGKIDVVTTKDVSHTFYLIGDAGLLPDGGTNRVLKAFGDKLKKANKNSTALFLGDNIYPKGLPAKKDDPEGHKSAKRHLDAQLKTLEGFKGKPVFIPGNHDWYSGGLEGLMREQKYLEKKTNSKDIFFPKNGCPIKRIKISDDIVVIAIDTEWYLTNWDRHPTMNDACEIKDREKFFAALESEIKKNANKTTIIAMHHPMFSYGNHGGQFSLKQQLYPGHSNIPLPVLGTFINVLRKTSGASIEDLQNKRYTQMKNRVVTLAQYSDRVIFTSGHEHSLQYIVKENTPQIISGAGAKSGATRMLKGSLFSTGKMGYSVVQVFTDGSSRVKFYGVDLNGNEEFLYSSEVLPPKRTNDLKHYKKNFPSTVSASIYTKEEVTKSKFFKWMWGERYRKYYATKVKVPTVDLDTLFGGVKVLRKGGGHQSKSLRLVNNEGKEYVMRALKKSAEVYLQAMAFKEQYVVGDFEDTFTERILEDFYTGAHPYAPFVVGALSDAVGIYHTNPKLYYIPKQHVFRDYDDEFGDELYMIEERTDSGHGNLKSFGYANTLISTDDVLKKLRKDEKYSVDKEAYVKARLFDMLIGDWDRHTDQWRWAEFKDPKNGKVQYKPIPRDRDQVFSEMGDGFLMGIATRIIPSLTLMEGFNNKIRSVKGFNGSPMTFALDMTLLPETTFELWEEQVAVLQKKLTEEVIDEALLQFPIEVRDKTSVEIKNTLLSRKADLLNIAKEYYYILNEFSVVTGTDKDDYFTVTGLSNGKTEVVGYRIKKGKKGTVFFRKIYDKKITKEIWIYGLDDDDYFEVRKINSGNSKVRIVGGQNNDIYDINDSRRVFVYDQKLKKNTIKNPKETRLRLTRDYDINTYQPIRLKSSANQIIPVIGSNPDDGFKIGLINTYTYNGFLQNPFTSQHTINASYYFATSGFDLGYQGEFANVIGRANLELKVKFTSPNYSINFFGFGNDSETTNDNLDYNRVKLQTLKFAPSLVWRGDMESKIRTGVSYETIEVEETSGRFINTFYVVNGGEVRKNFLGVDAQYSYENQDNAAFPTLGMATSLHIGYKADTSGDNASFGYVIPSLSFDYKLVPSGRLVLATKWKAHFNVGDGFEFYQGATIGGLEGLRGFRNQRFTGKKAYYQNTDIRYRLLKKKTGLLPVTLGFFGGYDYGRVWQSQENSDKWHTSYGGGFFLNGADIVTARIAIFNSVDGARFSFGLGFGF